MSEWQQQAEYEQRQRADALLTQREREARFTNEEMVRKQAQQDQLEYERKIREAEFTKQAEDSRAVAPLPTTPTNNVTITPFNARVEREISGVAPGANQPEFMTNIGNYVDLKAKDLESYENMMADIPNFAVSEISQIKQRLNEDKTLDPLGTSIVKAIINSNPITGKITETAINQWLGRDIKPTDIAPLIVATAFNFGIGAYHGATGFVRPSTWTAPLKLLNPSERTRLVDYISANQFDFVTQTAGGLVGGYFTSKGGQAVLIPIKDKIYTSIFNKLSSEHQFVLNPKLAYSKLSYKKMFPGESDYNFMDVPETIITEERNLFVDVKNVPVSKIDADDFSYKSNQWAKTTLYKKSSTYTDDVIKTADDSIKPIKPSDISNWNPEEFLYKKSSTYKEGGGGSGAITYGSVENAGRQQLIMVSKTAAVATIKTEAVLVSSVNIISDYAYKSGFGFGSTTALKNVVTQSNLYGLIGGMQGATVPNLRTALKLKGLTPQMIDLSINILIKPQTLQTLEHDLPKLNPTALKVVVQTINPDLLVPVLKKLDPALASEVLTQQNYALISYILPRLDEKTLTEVLLKSDTVISTAILPITSTVVITDVLTKMDTVQIVELINTIPTPQLEKIIEKIPNEKWKYILPKLKDNVRKKVNKILSKIDKLLYRVEYSTYKIIERANSFRDAINKTFNNKMKKSSKIRVTKL